MISLKVALGYFLSTAFFTASGRSLAAISFSQLWIVPSSKMSASNFLSLLLELDVVDDLVAFLLLGPLVDLGLGELGLQRVHHLLGDLVQVELLVLGERRPEPGGRTRRGGRRTMPDATCDHGNLPREQTHSTARNRADCSPRAEEHHIPPQGLPEGVKCV